MNDQVDVAVDDSFDTEAVEPLITPRRILRWTAIVTTAIVAILVCWDGASVAQDGVRLTGPDDGRGAGWVDTVLVAAAGVVGLLAAGAAGRLLRRRHG